LKLRLEKLTLEPRHSFVLQHDLLPYYPTPWHYHPEYELVLVVRSTGQRIVGDWIENFADGDLVLMGPNLPHVYNNDPAYHEGHPDLVAEAIVIHFREDSFGKGLFALPEMIPVQKLFDRSRFGLKIGGDTQGQVAELMHRMLCLSGPRRIILLLQILDLLSLSPDLQPLASPGFVQQYNTSGTDRLTRVYDYIMTNFRNDITLASVAEMASMSPPSFCRFFKACTRKSFSRFLNEIRVGYACKLLLEDKLNISQICYESGFHNVSNFNRQFRKITSKPPLRYKKEKYG
jgi:AraC-like DNA-binding protein